MLSFDVTLDRIRYWDGELTRRANRASQAQALRWLFGKVSRLGDGLFWYALMALLLAVYGAQALRPVLHMAFAGLCATLLYKWLKHKTLRPRPFELDRELLLSVAPLDQYSFPSGHTLHAFVFTWVALAYYPVLAWILVPFTLLVSLSRLVLGLHYPSDVLAAAVLGSAIALASLTI